MAKVNELKKRKISFVALKACLFFGKHHLFIANHDIHFARLLDENNEYNNASSEYIAKYQ